MGKVDRAFYGPSQTEIIRGAPHGLGLGVALALAALVLQPVAKAKEVPRDASIGAAGAKLGAVAVAGPSLQFSMP